jgi:pimeloyl-ACP methyl ester carboxylesterase/DNA-binding winged helix-turn-helix (wHTH) protein
MQFLFDDQLLDVDRRELRRGARQIEMEPQVFDLLAYLLQNRDRVVSKDDLIAAVWNGRIVSESTLTSRINAARRAIGDDGQAQCLIRTYPRKGFRFVGNVLQTPAPGERRPAPPSMPQLRQDIHFCTAKDGVRIAYADVGRGPLLVKAANWLNHLEYDWQSPVWSPLFRVLTARYRLIRYDARGNGLSDWNVEDVSFEAFVRDLESVIEATGVQRFALFGMSQGCAISVAYAARHPERVSHLILYGGVVRGRRKRGSVKEIQKSDALLTLMTQGWGQENPAFRQIFTSLFMPGGSPEQIDWFNDLQRMTTTPEMAARLRRTMDDIDISEFLPRVRVPTLVMHLREDAMQPFEQGRQLAAGIKGSRFVVLEGRNHVILDSDPGWQRFHDEIADFIAS